MKRFGLLVVAGIGLLALAVALVKQAKQGDEPKVTEGSPVKTDADLVESDPELVFQKALWRRPSEQDRILQAERREWVEEDSVTKWEWFLEVEPSKELRSYLWEENAFSLREMKTQPPKLVQVPEWFRFDPASTVRLGSDDGSMDLYFLPDRIFATGKGGGFREGAERPIRKKSATQKPTTGRLPNRSPEIPKP